MRRFAIEQDANKLRLLIDILSQDVHKHPGWIERKEVAAWAAVVFYIVGLWSLFSFVADYENPFDFLVLILLVILLIVLFISIFFFVHAQYSSIYFNHAYSSAVQRAIYELIRKAVKGQDIDIDLDFHNLDPYPKFIKELLEEQQKKVQPYRGKKHPIKILIEFWTFAWIWKKPEERKLDNHSKQEAAIYSLLIVSNFFFVIYLACRWMAENCYFYSY